MTLYARLLKEAGLITSGIRGVNAPHMHPRDAVRLTIALLATGTAAHAVRLYHRFASMTFLVNRSNGPHPDCFGVQDEATLEAVLLQMFTADMFPENGEGPFEFAPYLEIQENQRIAKIEHSPLSDGKLGTSQPAATIRFGTRNRSDEMAIEDRRAHGGILVSRGLSSACLFQCALPFYLERQNKIAWETMERETEEEKEQRFRSGNYKPAKGLWFDRDIEECR